MGRNQRDPTSKNARHEDGDNALDDIVATDSQTEAFMIQQVWNIYSHAEDLGYNM